MARSWGFLFSTLLSLSTLNAASGRAPAQEPLKVGIFAVDASPPVGSPLAYDPTKEVTLPLSCRGIVLLGQGEPIILCAVDWIGIGNDGQTEFRDALAKAAGTQAERVAVHTLHQHDAPHCDFSADRLLATYGIQQEVFDAAFARRVMQETASAVRQAVAQAKPVTHVGIGQADVQKVASNRRILGPDGKVQFVRYTACADPEIRDKPVGTIDPMVKIISLWNGDTPLVALSNYATHPQSYYRTGQVNPDFPGMARDQRQQETGIPHIHFDGAGGNIGAGKWNDGAHENRQVLANRVADGMKRAWENTQKTSVSAADLGWKVVPVALPMSPHLDGPSLMAQLKNAQLPARQRARAANDLAWFFRCIVKDTIDVSCLRLGSARILHLPGELFVEYQLAAQAMKPDDFVALAAYGDYGPGYIGTKVSYAEGGYETSPTASLVDPSVEELLLDVIKQLLSE